MQIDKTVFKEAGGNFVAGYHQLYPWYDWTNIYLNRLWGKEYLAQNNVTGVTAYMNQVFGLTRAPKDKHFKFQEVFHNETKKNFAEARVMSLTINYDKFFWRGFRLLNEHKASKKRNGWG